MILLIAVSNWAGQRDSEVWSFWATGRLAAWEAKARSSELARNVNGEASSESVVKPIATHLGINVDIETKKLFL